MITFSKVDKGTAMSRQRTRGFSMVELMFAMGILVIALAAILPTFMSLTKYLVSLGNYSEMSYDGRMAVELIARDIRGAESLEVADANSLTLQLPSDAGSVTVTYDYRYDGGEDDWILFREVTDSSGVTTSDILLTDLAEFAFVYYNRLGNESTVASRLTETKSINLDALMSRKVLQLKNTDNIISAKFMMRNAN